MNIYTESMTKLVIHELTIRAWREETKPESIDLDWSKEVTELITIAYDEIPEGEIVSFSDIANKFLAIERMNAIEILGPEGNGVVLYKNWP
jgi:hypothetical protein